MGAKWIEFKFKFSMFVDYNKISKRKLRDYIYT